MALVEQSPDRSEIVADGTVATVVQGDATRRSVLEQADVGRADALAALTADPGTNLAVCLLARDLADDGLFTLARTADESQREYTEDVDAVLLPHQSVANRAVDLLVGGAVRTFTGHDGGIEIVDLVVAEGASIAGHTLEETVLPDGCRVVAALTDPRLAGPDLTFRGGNRYLLALESTALQDVRMLFRE